MRLVFKCLVLVCVIKFVHAYLVPNAVVAKEVDVLIELVKGQPSHKVIIFNGYRRPF